MTEFNINHLPIWKKSFSTIILGICAQSKGPETCHRWDEEDLLGEYKYIY